MIVSKVKKWLTGCLLACVLVLGCSKDPGIEEVGMKLRFVHASPDATPLVFKLNEQEVAAAPLAYSDTTAYITYKGGTYHVSLGINGKEKVNIIIDFTPGHAYTVFAVDSSNKIKLSVINDDLTLPDQLLKTQLRFINNSPNSGALSVVGIAGKDTIALFVNRVFNEQATSNKVAQFTRYKSNQYKLLLVSGNTIVATLPSVIFAPYRSYTIYTRGFVGGTGNQALSMDILPNN